ncbi:MAG: GNAT family N-acetyltransferase, partial [Clostridia bacterium]
AGLSVPGRRIPELDEILMFRETADCPIPSSLPLRSDGHPEEIAESGAFPRGTVDYASKVGMELFVMVDESGGWLSRCHVEPRPRHLGEIAGVETRPRHRRKGHAVRMLRALATMLHRQYRGLLYLSLLENRPSRMLSSRAGFSPVTVFQKHLLS